ncbi:GNAT family N-acetyltransferase [Catenulispora rubra]|uniref:GNAT family N-acetyltransferase n=1 Tax=Catenulispora rubra TaxID=280293 RepID=UPI00189233D5|nr:GNAT family N-acetyltransferase [Catenulispora rubra]
MTDLHTDRLRLHPFTVEEGRRVVDVTPAADDSWAEDFPMQDDRDGVKGFLGAAEAGHDAGPFGCYRIDRDGTAIGTIGFYGPPDEEGQVMFGYGLVPGARGAGYATEALAGLVEMCRTHEAVRAMVADTEASNVASQRVLDKTGFALVKEEGGMYYYRLEVAEG